MKTGAVCAAFVLGLALSTVALAAEPEATDKTAEGADKPAADKPATDAKPDEKTVDTDKGGSEHADEKFGHGGQFGLRAGIVGGYRMIFRYDKSPFCHAVKPGVGDKDQQKFCGNGAPFATDLALSFAVLDFIEPYVWARFGFSGEASTDTQALTAFGAGARIYTTSESKFKVFVEPAVAVETEGGGSDKAQWFNGGTVQPDYKTDFLFHLGVGPQYDFAHAFGAYLNFGLTTGVLRYIHTELEVSGGVQLRVP